MLEVLVIINVYVILCNALWGRILLLWIFIHVWFHEFFYRWEFFLTWFFPKNSSNNNMDKNLTQDFKNDSASMCACHESVSQLESSQFWPTNHRQKLKGVKHLIITHRLGCAQLFCVRTLPYITGPCAYMRCFLNAENQDVLAIIQCNGS